MAKYNSAQISLWPALINLLSQSSLLQLLVWLLYIQAQFFGLPTARAQKVTEVGLLPYSLDDDPVPLDGGRYGRCLSLNSEVLDGTYDVQVQPETVICFTADSMYYHPQGYTFYAMDSFPRSELDPSEEFRGSYVMTGKPPRVNLHYFGPNGGHPERIEVPDVNNTYTTIQKFVGGKKSAHLSCQQTREIFPLTYRSYTQLGAMRVWCAIQTRPSRLPIPPMPNGLNIIGFFRPVTDPLVNPPEGVEKVRKVLKLHARKLSDKYMGLWSRTTTVRCSRKPDNRYNSPQVEAEVETTIPQDSALETADMYVVTDFRKK